VKLIACLISFVIGFFTCFALNMRPLNTSNDSPRAQLGVPTNNNLLGAWYVCHAGTCYREHMLIFSDKMMCVYDTNLSSGNGPLEVCYSYKYEPLYDKHNRPMTSTLSIDCKDITDNHAPILGFVFNESGEENGVNGKCIANLHLDQPNIMNVVSMGSGATPNGSPVAALIKANTMPNWHNYTWDKSK
jgi:hypothetical protein